MYTIRVLLWLAFRLVRTGTDYGYLADNFVKNKRCAENSLGTMNRSGPQEIQL